ncbi:MAG: SRPBCC family protein [Parvularculaceae bacterium]
MHKPIAAAASIAVSADPATVRAATLALDPVRIVQAKGFLPGVRSVVGVTAPWSAPGQTRTLTLTDGSTLTETLVAIEEDGYRYRGSDYSGPFRFLVKEANARFAVAPRADGATLSWTYEFTPKSGLAAAILSFLVDSQWNAFMDATLERLKADIERA